MAAPRRKVRLEDAPCSVNVQRGGVAVNLDGIPVSDAVRLACYLLDRFNEQQDKHPELEPPAREVVQIGGYHPIDTDDDGTEARRRQRRVGF